MIALTDTLRSLELDLASASTTTLKIVATFTDIRYSDQTKNAGTRLSTSNGVTDVIIVTAPTSGILRLIETISVTNPSGNDTETVRIYYDENGTEYDIIRVDLAASDMLFYDDNSGWRVLNSVGSVKLAIAGAHSSLTGLTDDDHTQYALLLGRGSSQILRGGTAASETLTLRGTSHATVGAVALNDLGGNVIIGGGTTASNLRLLEASGGGTEYTEFRTQAQAANITYILPADDGDANQVLSTNGTGTLDWVAPSAGGFTLGTEQASTSGTAITFTGIPAGTKMIIINLHGVSTNGTSLLLCRLGDAGGIEDTGYLGTGAEFGGVATSDVTGFRVEGFATAAAIRHAQIILTLEDSTDFAWTFSSMCARTDSAGFAVGAGRKLLSAELTQVNITTINGTDAFDAGVINISYI